MTRITCYSAWQTQNKQLTSTEDGYVCSRASANSLTLGLRSKCWFCTSCSSRRRTTCREHTPITLLCMGHRRGAGNTTLYKNYIKQALYAVMRSLVAVTGISSMH